jgi:MerR family redox-sensitive transcriptional activator SoxR
MEEYLTIGEVAARTGVATSALRFYEDRSLISSERTDGNQRRYPRSVIRTVSIIKAAQEVGVSLREISNALSSLPKGRTPTKRDWEKLATRWRSDLSARIAELETLRDDLDGCIGCGCLSLTSCAIFNPGDRVAQAGTGARFIVGDPRPSAVEGGRAR